MRDPALILLAYLLGSVSSAVIVSRLLGLPDPRKEGSGNPGATNVLRLGGRKAAVLVLAGDILKGLVPAALGKLLAVTPTGLAAIGFAAFVGHLYPVFFGFKGGKGVATALGVWLGISVPVGMALLAVWLVTAALFRLSSLAALVSALSAPLLSLWLVDAKALSVMAVIMTLVLIWRHRSNIRNLVNGTEPRIGDKHRIQISEDK